MEFENFKGFISIDSGIPKNSDYTDDIINIAYTSDDQFIDTGVNGNISSEYNNHPKIYATLRSFPNGTRNCYNLSPFGGAKGNKYLIRAYFMYGNYDGLNINPEFDLYLGVNHWTIVNVFNASRTNYYEIIHVSRTSNVSVCLVNTGHGVPFISGLELRPLGGDIYTAATEDSSLMMSLRYYYGDGHDDIRFSADTLDRIWRPYNQTTRMNMNHVSITSSTVNGNDSFRLPSAVMSTAVTPSTGNAIEIIWESSVYSPDGYHIYMHFEELQPLESNETRIFGIKFNGEFFSKPFQPDFLSAITIFNKIEAITNIKTTYRIERYWNGDPCIPRVYTWDSLNCSTDDFNVTRIISLDLSNNNFEGNVPDFLANMSSLEFLDISNNQLRGSIPPALLKKMENKVLSLSYEGNPNLCASESCGTQKKEKGLIIVVVSLASAVLLISLLSLALWKFFNHRRGVYDSSTTEQPENYEETQNVASSDPIASLPEQDKGGFIVPIHDERSNDSLCPDGWQFTYARIEKMTNNLDTPIGKGGFGTVYLGYKDDGIKVTKVAVKILSQKSDQGTTEFQNEIHVNHFRWLSVFTNLKILIEMHFGCRYYNTHALNEKSDVYSYGVVLHELITGKSAIIKELTPAHLHVTNWVRAQANIKDVADLRLEGKSHMMSLDKAIKIAKKCTSLKPASRPSMSIVVSQLGVCLDIEKHRRNQNNNSGSSSGSFFTPPSTM
ncbi:putative LRR receptor-like serine/threonine-protein kinase [Acorus calamus]|uniref:non-specific serine/threonine protein kinase n=1 Tax=Acorus calamus TaxID=4465 RepID=A0AAV9CQX1_ACOCL|nr:putative LRR receptor-like serine/threonine-protein kinase [Acorus calamus]